MEGRLRTAIREFSHQHPRVRGLQHRLGVLPLPSFTARHWERSLIMSADDDVAPTPRLIEMSMEAVAAAQQIDLHHLRDRQPGPTYFAEVWPGHHYRLLAAFVQTRQAKNVIEIGTATGLSALAMISRLPADGRLTTFDIVRWSEYPGSVLREGDFADGRLVQHIDDLSDQAATQRYADLLRTADIIFIDAKHDGIQEQQFLDNFESIPFAQPPLLVFDDIRQWDMLGFWRSIRKPKLDITSFGSWSGTGLVDWAG
jgi:predicted O-methyltransferase YrrM